MANLDVTPGAGVVDKRFGRGTSTTPMSASVVDLSDIGAMRARLNAISATSYSAARLNSMTKNDMVYAIRLNDQAAGI